MSRMKVLVSAYACEPKTGSEPGVGWHWVREMARFHEIWVITRENNRTSIELELVANPMSNVHWIYFDLPRWARFWKKGRRGVHLYYYLWQLGAYLLARRLHRKVAFELAHHVTLVTYWMPSFLALLPIPFVWGPVGGGESGPFQFLKTMSLRGRMYEHLRDAVRWLAQLDPLLRRTVRRARVAIATTEETADRIRRLGCTNVLVYSQVGLSPEELEVLGTAPVRAGEGPVRFLSIGSLLDLKGFHLALEAFARVRQRFVDSEYWILGDGPERKRLERLAQTLCVSGSVTFFGWQDRAIVFKRLGECDVVLHPSLHDSGGWACVEALAAGRPVVCLDLGGPSVLVGDEVGIRVPATTPASVVSTFSESMQSLAGNPQIRKRLGEEARRWVRHNFDWHSKGEWMNTQYEEAVRR